jgi:ubiquinone/menaquinone biosynthesis C-methylase UbiE
MTQASRDYFAANADQWDALRSTYFSQQVREKATRKAYLRPEMWAADVGAGTGFLSAELAKMVERVYVLDASPEMLAVARKNLAAFDNVICHEAEGHLLPLADGSLDVVFANMFLHHCPDPLAAIQEMTRLLKPGGRLVITDLQAHNYTWMQTEMADVWLGFERAQIQQWLQQAGLVNILVEFSGEICSAASTSERGEDALKQAQVDVFLAVGSQRVSEVHHAVRENYALLARGASACCTPLLDQDANAVATESKDVSELNSSLVGSVVGCCSGSTPLVSLESVQVVSFEAGYQPDQSTDLPEGVREFSLGCGNPTALADLCPGEVVLDIGSGGGLDAMLAARQVGPQGHVIGVDMTPEMLARARTAVKKAGFSQVEFRKGRAEALPVAANHVDVILSNCVINLSEDKGRAFQEAYRVLKPGGRMEISDVVADGVFPWEWRADPRNWGGCVFGALPEDEYLDLIRQAGFEEIEVRHRASTGEAAGVKLNSITLRAVKRRVAPKQSADCECSA